MAKRYLTAGWLSRSTCVLAITAAASAVAAPGDSWTIAGNRVNLRSGPTVSAEIMGQLNLGLLVVERRSEGDWYEVEVIDRNGMVGWVHKSLLEGGRAPIVRPTLPVKPGLSQRQPAAVMPMKVEPAIGRPLPEIELPDEQTLIERMLTHVNRQSKLPKEPASERIGKSGREIISPVPLRKPGDQSRLPTELVLTANDVPTMADPEAMELFRESVSYLNNRAWSVAGIKLFSEIEPVGGGVVRVRTTEDWFDVPKIGQESYLRTLLDRWFVAKADGGPAGIMLVSAGGDLLMQQTKP